MSGAVGGTPLRALAGPRRGMKRGTYVRMRNGIVGVFLWSYENPVHRPGYHDRANVGVGDETWSASLGDLRPVELHAPASPS